MDLPQDLCLYFIRTNLIYSLYSNFANKFYSNFAEQFDWWDEVEFFLASGAYLAYSSIAKNERVPGAN